MAVADRLGYAETLPVLIMNARLCTAVLLVAGSLTAAVCIAGETSHVDLLIRQGTVVDGTGAPPRVADVAVSGERIVEVGRHLKVSARQDMDARGMVVAPGFIDLHNHSDEALATAEGFLNEAFLRQGVTTVVLGPDGELAPAAIEALLQKYRDRGVGTNVAFYVGHNGIRTEVMGGEQNHAPGAAELARMEDLVRQGMESGAVGLSTGLMYSPGLFSETDEVVALAKQVKPFGGVYETHVRDPNKALLQSDWEAIDIARQASIPVDLTHLTTPGKNNRGLMRAVLDLIENARREGITVVADQYPYAAIATIQLWGVLAYPQDLALHDREAIRAALRDPDGRARIRAETLSGGRSGFSQYKASGPGSILVLSCPDLPAYEGRFITDIAAERGVDGFEAIVFLLENTRADIVVSLGGFYEEDMRRLMIKPWAMFASDGAVSGSNDSAGGFSSDHPRATGTFARVLGKYVREERVLTLEEAVRKATSAPADFLKLEKRGRISPGSIADLAIFDPRVICDRSTWKEPHAPPVGVVSVLVNGRFALRDGALTGIAAGQFVRRAAPAVVLNPRD
jgi:N-acyl-D-amino-acid deacylase